MFTRIILSFGLLYAFALVLPSRPASGQTDLSAAQEGMNPVLPEPFATPSVQNHPQVSGWPAGKKPTAPEGFRVEEFASLESPRWIYIGPSGEVFVSQSCTNRTASPNLITMLRDADRDGQPEDKKTIAEKLNQPLGMATIGETFYFANTDGVFAVPLEELLAKRGKPKKIAELPTGGYNNHWTRNLLPSRDGRKLYVSVGSGTNVAEQGIEHEKNRANILEMNPDGSDVRVFASGMRNPTGLDWEPVTGHLWTTVNERDGLGDDLVPDYLTSVKEGGFYGWPYCYFGQHKDPRLEGQRPDLVKSAIEPDFALGSHTASLGLTFYDGKNFPAKYQGGAFVAQRGSWNRSIPSGYKVIFVPFKDGRPTGDVDDFLTGFKEDSYQNKVYGRPVGVAVAADGSLLVTDESGGKIWRVVAQSGTR